MSQLRNVFYINYNVDESYFEYYGMDFKEFLSYVPIEINTLLLLEGEYYGRWIRSRTRFEVVVQQEMDELLNEDISSYGNFAWVDVSGKDRIEQLEPMEIAELLYLRHCYEPLHTPFFEKLDNQFVYLAHDDGWYCKLYCRFPSDFKEVIANKIIGTLSTLIRRTIDPLSDKLKDYLFSLTKNGLVVDFNRVIINDATIEVPIFAIGEFSNMDDMYNDLGSHISHAAYSARLEYKNNQWTLSNIM